MTTGTELMSAAAGVVADESNGVSIESLATLGGIIVAAVTALVALYKARSEDKTGTRTVASVENDNALKAQGATIVTLREEIKRKDEEIAGLREDVDKTTEALRIALTTISDLQRRITALEDKK